MKRMGPVIYGSDTDIEEDLEVLGPLIASKNLKAQTISLKGPLIVKENLEITGGALKVDGLVNIGKDLLCLQDININGDCLIGGIVDAGSLIIKGKVNATSISADKIDIRGSTTVEESMNASESVTIVVSRRIENKIGLIESPVVNLVFGSFYTRISRIPLAVLSKIGFKSKYRTDITVNDLNIKAETLNLIHSRPVDSIDYVFSPNCNIDVKEIRKIQKTIFYRT